MTEEREVVVTGMGAITPLGPDVASLWESLASGRSGIRPIEAFDASPYPCQIAGEVRDYKPPVAVPSEEASRMDRGALFAVDACLQALGDSALALTPQNAVQVALVLGSARPGETSVWTGQRAMQESGSASAGYLPRTLANGPATQASAALGVRGPTVAVSAGGASGSAALGLAAAMVRRGEVEAAIAGGADAAISPAAISSFCALRQLTTRNDEPSRASRPFDADADGFVVSEGAAALVLESADLARQRGARVYARLAGASSATQPGAIVAAPEEAGRAMQAALRQPALLQSEIDYVCAYAAGSPELDRMESDAVKRIFGAVTASKLTLSAPKSMLGHLLGASGAVDAIVCIKAIETGIVPPTINLDRPAEGCDLDYTPREARRQPVRNALCYSYGFGGQHLALCFSAA